MQRLSFEVGGREKEGQKLRRLEGERMWAIGLWRPEGGAFSGVRLETGKGKRIRRLEDQKLRRFGPSAVRGLRLEALGKGRDEGRGWRLRRR